MNNPEKVTFHLIVYTAESRWDGEMTIPARRRLSDFFNDQSSTFLLLNHVFPATWNDNSWRVHQEIESIALAKHSIIAIIPGADAPPSPPMHPSERVTKTPFRAIIYAPPIILTCALHIPNTVGWLESVNVSRTEFLPVTDVTTWYFQTRDPLETDVAFALVNRRWIVGMEPKQPGLKGDGESKEKYELTQPAGDATP